MKPIIKWPGGKRKLVDRLIPTAMKINNYCEPFVGGGAVAFKLLGEKRIKGTCTISDINEELINVYRVVRDDARNLVSKLLAMQSKHNKSFYYEMREQDRLDTYAEMSNLDKAVRFIYLNKTCFNGLYRVNSKGQFNVPIGSYTNPVLVVPEDVYSLSCLLEDVLIECLDYKKILSGVVKDTLVYLDPPYAPLTKTSNFVGYSKEGFSLNDQEELSELVDLLTRKGVSVIQSNSGSSVIYNLYKHYQIIDIKVRRSISANSDSREEVKEVIITNDFVF